MARAEARKPSAGDHFAQAAFLPPARPAPAPLPATAKPACTAASTLRKTRARWDASCPPACRPQRLDDHPRAVFLQRAANVRRRPRRIAHVVQAIEERHEIVVLAGISPSLSLPRSECDRRHQHPSRAAWRFRSTCRDSRSRQIPTSDTTSPSRSLTRPARSRRRQRARRSSVFRRRLPARESTKRSGSRHSPGGKIARCRRTAVG